jgi:hypothetical protein
MPHLEHNAEHHRCSVLGQQVWMKQHQLALASLGPWVHLEAQEAYWRSRIAYDYSGKLFLESSPRISRVFRHGSHLKIVPSLKPALTRQKRFLKSLDPIGFLFKLLEQNWCSKLLDTGLHCSTDAVCCFLFTRVVDVGVSKQNCGYDIFDPEGLAKPLFAISFHLNVVHSARNPLCCVCWLKLDAAGQRRPFEIALHALHTFVTTIFPQFRRVVRREAPNADAVNLPLLWSW